MKFKNESSPLKLLSQSQPNFAEMILGWSPSKIVSGISDLRPRWPPLPNLILHRTLWEIPIKIFLSETICSIRTKFLWNSHWMVLFQKCVRRWGPSTKMAPTVELSLTLHPIGNSHKNLLFRNHWVNSNQTLVEWSLDNPLPKLCLVIPTFNQDGRQARNRKKGGWN
jgi:hypothetical protein